VPVASFGDAGVDLKKDDDQEMDLITGEIGLHSTPTVAKNVVIVGAAHKTGAAKSRHAGRATSAGSTSAPAKRLRIFHTIPLPGEFGNDTWEKDSWAYTEYWRQAQISADEELGLAYLPWASDRRTTAAIVQATACSEKASSPSICRRGSASGTTSSSTMASGTTTFRARRS
jgi:hypothetical protein